MLDTISRLLSQGCKSPNEVWYRPPHLCSPGSATRRIQLTRLVLSLDYSNTCLCRSNRHNIRPTGLPVTVKCQCLIIGHRLLRLLAHFLRTRCRGRQTTAAGSLWFMFPDTGSEESSNFYSHIWDGWLSDAVSTVFLLLTFSMTCLHVTRSGQLGRVSSGTLFIRSRRRFVHRYPVKQQLSAVECLMIDFDRS